MREVFNIMRPYTRGYRFIIGTGLLLLDRDEDSADDAAQGASALHRSHPVGRAIRVHRRRSASALRRPARRGDVSPHLRRSVHRAFGAFRHRNVLQPVVDHHRLAPHRIRHPAGSVRQARQPLGRVLPAASVRRHHFTFDQRHGRRAHAARPGHHVHGQQRLRVLDGHRVADKHRLARDAREPLPLPADPPDGHVGRQTRPTSDSSSFSRSSAPSADASRRT